MMGIKLIILLVLVVGALYCLHLLAQDFQAIRMPKLFRLFKRDAPGLEKSKPHVRWKKILSNDPLQCAQLIFCDLGTIEPRTEVEKKLIYMLTLKPQTEDQEALETFKQNYNYGKSYKSLEHCKVKHETCPFTSKTLLHLFEYIIKYKL